MKKETRNQNQTGFQTEPENYNSLRGEMKELMLDLKNLKDRLRSICDSPVISEQFSERSTEMCGEVSQIIWTLGEMYGYTLADDVTEGTIN